MQGLIRTGQSHVHLGQKCPNSKLDEHIKLLRKLADHSALPNKHSACLIKRDKIFSFGYNKYIKKDKINNQDIKFTIHAEIDAMCKLDNKLVKGLDILIIRIGNCSKTSKLRNSRPCNSCINKLLQRGIRKVYYSNESGEIVYEFTENMPKIHTSSGDKIRNLYSFRFRLTSS